MNKGLCVMSKCGMKMTLSFEVDHRILPPDAKTIADLLLAAPVLISDDYEMTVNGVELGMFLDKHGHELLTEEKAKQKIEEGTVKPEDLERAPKEESNGGILH